MKPQDRQPLPAVVPPAAMGATLPFLMAPAVFPTPWPVPPSCPPHMPPTTPPLAGILPGTSPVHPCPLAAPRRPPRLRPLRRPCPGVMPFRPSGLVTPVRAVLPEIMNLVAEFRSVALDPARADPGSIATLPSADIIPFSRCAGVSIDNWLDQMEFRLKSCNFPPPQALGSSYPGTCSSGSVGGDEEVA